LVRKTLAVGLISNVSTIYAVQEPGGSGETFVRNVRERLADLGWKGKLLVARLDGAKDPNDLHKQDPARFPQRWREALAKAEPIPLAAPSVGSVGTRRVYRPLPPFQPFPLDALPPVLSRLVPTAADTIGCDPALVVPAALAAAAGCVGNSRALVLKKGWIEPCVIWAMSVAESGGHKSPAYHAAIDPLMELQLDLFDAHEEETKEYERALEEWKATPKEQRGDRPEKPAEPLTFTTSDTTIEALGELLRGNPRGLLVARDELDAWFQGFIRYQGKNGGTNRAHWLELHKAGTLRLDRLTREQGRLSVRRAAVSVTGTIQPGVLARALDLEALQAGLGARFLFTMPPRRRRVWTEKELPDDLVALYEQLLSTLLQLPLADERRRKPHYLGLSEAALRLWISFYNEWGEVQYEATGEQAAAFAKIEAYASRLMLLHHVVAHAAAGEGDVRPVTEASARAGIAMARWFAAEALRVYAMLWEGEQERQTRLLVEAITARGGTITVRQLQKSNSRRWPSSDLAEAVLNDLAQLGLGRWEESPAPKGGGHRARTFHLNKPSDTSDTRQSADDDPDAGPTDTCPDACPPGPDFDPGLGGTSTDNGEIYGSPGRGTEGRVSEVSDVGNGESSAEGANSQPAGAGRVSEASVGTVDLPCGTLVRGAADLPSVVNAVEESAVVGLDVETTGLSPRKDRVRLLSLATDRGTWLLDLFALPANALREQLFPVLADATLLGHNLAFDLSFLAAQGFEPGKVADIMLLSRLLHGTRHARDFHGLAECCRRELGQELPKDLQASDWSSELSPEQLDYAARDVLVLRPLYDRLTTQIIETGQAKVAEIEHRALPAVCWLARSGVALDTNAWVALAWQAEAGAEALAKELDAAAPRAPQGELYSAGWNWSSAEQVKAVFRALDITLACTEDEALAAVNHPLAGLLRRYRAASKLVSTYGDSWSKHVTDGRVYASWQQIGADSGRMACRTPNLQNLPRDPRYRRCFIAPPGRVLVKADYSQLQLRIAAKIASEGRMLEAYARGEDLHTLTARSLTGKAEVTKADRQLAKAVNFGLLFGLGAKGLRGYAKCNYGLDLTEADAGQYRRAFFTAYPGLEGWHRREGNSRATECRTLAGRRRLLDDGTPYTHRLNTPVQGTEADGAKLAMALLWERRGECPGAFPVLFVHDEIVVECDEAQAERATAWLRQAMLDGMAPLMEPVPCEVEVRVRRTWGGQ
jgi:DNA polymerase-1